MTNQEKGEKLMLDFILEYWIFLPITICENLPKFIRIVFNLIELVWFIPAAIISLPFILIGLFIGLFREA